MTLKRYLASSKWYDNKGFIDNKPLFVVFPSLRGGWNAQVVPRTAGSREARLDFPAEWVENKPEGLDFIHKGLFLIATEDKNTAVKLCQLAITKQ